MNYTYILYKYNLYFYIYTYILNKNKLFNTVVWCGDMNYKVSIMNRFAAFKMLSHRHTQIENTVDRPT